MNHVATSCWLAGETMRDYLRHHRRHVVPCKPLFQRTLRGDHANVAHTHVCDHDKPLSQRVYIRYPYLTLRRLV